MIHSHYTGRVVAKLYDNCGLGRYAGITLRGKTGALVTFISACLTPALSGESGQAAAQHRYIDCHKSGLPACELHALAVMGIAELVVERDRAGPAAIVGGDLQTDVLGGSKVHSQLIQKQWGREDLVLSPLDEDASPWTHWK